MNTPLPSTGNLYLIVGYDGSAPAARALDSAAALLRGREGGIDVVYVPHLPAMDMLSADAVAGMETTFDEITRDLQAQAALELPALLAAAQLLAGLRVQVPRDLVEGGFHPGHGVG